MVEYDFGNSPSGDGSDGELQSPARATGGERVVMMYDDNGNAVPMPMGNFYYDTYNPDDASSEEEDELKRSSDTERSNKPAALSMNDEESDGSSKESYTDDESNGDDDQFMRIQVAAVPLKAAQDVQQDLDHDKGKSRPKIGQMVRAISSVKGGGGGGGGSRDLERARTVGPGATTGSAREKAAAARAAASKPGGSRQGVAAVGRMLSITKDKKQGTQQAGRLDQDAEQNQNQDRRRAPNAQNSGAASKGQKRQGIGAVGRMLSFKKNKEEKIGQRSSNSDSISPEKSQAHDPSTQRDRGASSTEKSANSPGQRMGIGQIGRMMSKRKQDAPDTKESEDGAQFVSRERRETEQSGSVPGAGARAGIKQVGRMISISKKPQEQGSGFTASDSKPVDSANLSDRDRSTSKPVDSANLSDRDRSTQNTSAPNVRKEGSRMGLKAAGRLLSFSRKPAPPKANSKQDAPVGGKGGPDVPQAPIRIAPPTSPRLDGRANKFFFSEINSTEIAKSSVLDAETHIRIPVLVLAEYSGPVSKNKWFIDAFTLPHNAVRRECIDLYDILMALARCNPEADITTDDMKDFHSWWVVAEKFIKCYFDMEREVLFPWVNVAGSKDWELQMALGKMRTMKDGLQEQLAVVNKAWETLGSGSPGETFGSLYKAIDVFCPRLMNYFADQELLLPQIVKGYYRIEDRLVMDKDMLASFIGTPLTRKTRDLEHHNLVLLIRWIANPRQLRAWISKNLNSTGRSSYAKWHAMYEADHSRIVKAFRNRSRVSTIAAMNQS